MRRPGIEPGSTAWKAAMLTTIPPTLVMYIFKMKLRLVTCLWYMFISLFWGIWNSNLSMFTYKLIFYRFPMYVYIPNSYFADFGNIIHSLENAFCKFLNDCANHKLARREWPHSAHNRWYIFIISMQNAKQPMSIISPREYTLMCAKVHMI